MRENIDRIEERYQLIIKKDNINITYSDACNA